MRRREFIAGLGSVAAWPLVARAEAPYLADRLAAYAEALQFADLDAATIEAAKAHLIDALGCAISALDEEPVRICREVALAAGGRAATVLGTGDKTTVDLAAFANGVAVRYFDLNDFYVGRSSGTPVTTPRRALPSPRRSRRAERISSPRSCSPMRSTAG
jgi:2-methylcitrate dehydratase